MRTNPRSRQRMTVMLHMVMVLVIMILVAQLWLFAVTLETIESGEASTNIVMAASICSLAACVAVWALIRLFLRAEEHHWMVQHGTQRHKGKFEFRNSNFEFFFV